MTDRDMTDDDVLDETIRTVLDLPADADLAGVAYGETERWDSVGHMELVAALEEAFGITLPADDVFEMSDYSAVRDVVERRRQAGHAGAGS